MKKIIIIVAVILLVLLFVNNGNKSSVNNTKKNVVSNSSYTCPTPEEYWQKYVELNNSPEKVSEYEKQIFTKCSSYFKSTSTPDCEKLYPLTALYFGNKISKQELLGVIESLNGKCKAQYNDIQDMINKSSCVYSVREHKCY